MTKYLRSESFTESAGGAADENQWEQTFGARVKMRCPKGCPPMFCKRKDHIAGQTGSDPEEWVCKHCGTPAEQVSRVMEAIEQEQKLQQLMNKIIYEDD